ncbi:hypothetical protein PJM46_29585, partial [Mycobacterium kansasii]
IFLDTGNILAPNYDIKLGSFNINAISLGFSQAGYIQQFNFPSIQIGAMTLPTLTISNNGGPYVFPSLTLSGFDVPQVTVPPIGINNFTLPS